MAFQVLWPIKAGNAESITFVYPGTLTSETFACEVRARKSLTDNDTENPLLATASCNAVQVSTNIEVTVSLTAEQTRTLAPYRKVCYDVQVTLAGSPDTYFEGDIEIDGDVTK